MMHSTPVVQDESPLPVPATPLIGRERERVEVCSLLQRPEVRLLTLTGVGGIGKTRLGLQIAAELHDGFSDGVCFVPLAPISDPDLVISTIAQTLGIKEIGARLPLDVLKISLRDKHVLLLLDNFEQVARAAPVLSELLTACPNLKLLVTSRATLHVHAEYEFPVPSLALPNLKQLPEWDVLSHYGAVALFLDRAQATLPTFQMTATNAHTIAEICLRLDGLPLAIELAAHRIKLLPPQALLSRLEHRLQVLTSGSQDAPTRQQTLRNTIQWSYDLLSAREQRLFRRLAVFVGGCSFEALDTVYQTLGDKEMSVFDGVASLLDKNLLQQTEREGKESRLEILETLREFGLEMVAAHGEKEVTRQAHALYYLALAEAASVDEGGPQGAQWMARLDQEHDNLRAAMNWLLERGETEMALRLGIALRGFWFVSRRSKEGWHFLERALAGSEEVAASIRVKGLYSAGNMAMLLGHLEYGETLCKEGLALARQVGDPKGIYQATANLGYIALSRCDFVAARLLLEENLAISRKIDDKSLTANALSDLAWLALSQGEYTRGHSFVEEGIALFRELGNTTEITYSLILLTLLSFYQGDLASARTLAEESLMLAREVGNKGLEVDALNNLGEIALYQGDTTTAYTLFEKSCAYYREIGNEKNFAILLSYLGKAIATQGDYKTARAYYEESLLRQEVESSLALAEIPFALEGLAVVVAAQGEDIWATRLWGAAEALRETLRLPLPPVYYPDYQRAIAATRARMGEQPFAGAWSEGRTMTPQKALAARGPAAISAPLPTEQPSPSSLKPPNTYPDGLTTREVDVLRLVAQGLTDAHIAEHLVISPRTVNTHLTSIYHKIQVSSRSAATRYVLERHLL